MDVVMHSQGSAHFTTSGAKDLGETGTLLALPRF